MSGERWERLNEVFHAARAHAGEERRAFLADACAHDPPLRAEVERLLAAHERAGAFIDAPAVASAGPWLDGEGEPAVGRVFGPYRVVRELGRGGMGAVYLAERVDGHFEQRVAIKLIKRGMDTDLVLERFRAERQILASLDHANIARLLDGGAGDDERPYFVMEYIEGEPIDQYADARRLSVAERLRLFLLVCDAVSYAHRHRVIHRDIKPVNVLVTADGAPKLLDFGIAKVLHPGEHEPTSGVTGLRLLTPEYASPEQVDGRHATAASDVYSLGVMLYELVTGRSPYGPTSGDPAELAEAVRTSDPERPSAAVTRPAREGRARRARLTPDRAAATGMRSTEQLRRLLRGDLDTIVLTALRKEPARRYASVDHLADDVRRHLDGRPVRARADTVAYRAGKYLRRNRAAVVAASLAGVAALLLGAGAVSLRTARARPGAGGEPSLLAAGALRPRDRLLVADFADRAGDSTLAAAVTEALRVDLTQSPLVRVLTPRQVRVTLTRMERSPDVALDDSVAREVAMREGVKAIVTGSIAKVAGGYTVAVQLLGAERGDALAAFRETAADSSELIGTIDRVSKRLRNRIGESLRELGATLPLADATTGSLPALRTFTAGQRLFRAGDRTGAIRLYEQAAALDTGFGAAHVALASAYASIAEPGRAKAAMRHAMANRHRLPFRDRYAIVASNAYDRGDLDSAITAYARILERYPDDVRALNNLALVHRDQRRHAVAESLFARAAGVDSTIANLYFGIHTAQLLQGRFAESRRTLDLIARRFPGNPILGNVEVQDASAQQRWEEAARRARATIAAARADTLALIDPHEALSAIAMTRGRLAEAERGWRTHRALSTAAGSHGRLLFGVAQRAHLHLRYRNDTARAVAVVDSALQRLPLDSVLPGDRPYDDLARFYAAAGRLDAARALLAAADANDRALGRNLAPDRHWTRGVIALAERQAARAEAELQEAADTHVCAMCALPALARAHEANGRPQAAVAAYERYLRTPWLFRYEADAVELGWAMRRLGELHEARGDTAAAADAYARVLHLWRGADPELQRVLTDVRRRLAALGAGAGAAAAPRGR